MRSTWTSVSLNAPSVRTMKSARRDLSFGWPLRREPRTRGRLAQPALEQTRDLQLRRARGHDDRSKSRIASGFEQQRHIDDGKRAPPMSSKARKPAAIAR